MSNPLISPVGDTKEVYMKFANTVLLMFCVGMLIFAAPGYSDDDNVQRL